jgi:hypothetical protein
MINLPGDNKVTLYNGEDVMGFFLFMLLWPLTVPTSGIMHYLKIRKTHILEKGKNIIDRRNMERISVHDRSSLIEIPEQELKFLLKWHREGYLSYSKQILEMVRDELMHRSAERDLLK